MKKLWTRKSLLISSMILSLLAFGATWASPDGRKNVKANLTGFQEPPSVSSTGRGEFGARIDEESQTITYTLSYSRLEGTTTLFAHIHLGQHSVNGGIAAFLCGGGDKPPCPATEGTVTGVIDPADIIGPTGQGLAPAEFAEFVRAIRSGNTYANVHTNKHPGGEIRGQIKGNDNDDDHDNGHGH
jgi:hypothetical protein